MVSFTTIRMREARLRATFPNLLEVPPELRPRGMPAPPQFSVPTSASLASLRAAIADNPLDQRLVNLYFVQLAHEKGAFAPALSEDAALLARLGWRDNAAQQNLLLRDAVTGQLSGALDRVDALLRRERLREPAYQILQLIERDPNLHRHLMERLERGVPWRKGYLGYPVSNTDRTLQNARIGTLQALLRSGTRLDNAEIAPFLGVLVASARGQDALLLWERFTRIRIPQNTLNDEDFSSAQQRSLRSDVQMPFEWEFGSGPGFSASVTQQDEPQVTLRWDGNGVPIFMTQLFPITRSAVSLRVLSGDGDEAVPPWLQFAVRCPSAEATFQRQASNGREMRFSANLAALDCRIAEFVVSSRPRDSFEPPAPFRLKRLQLRQDAQ